jgi:hypothetical protein
LTEAAESNYSIRKTDDLLVFRTAHFRAGRGSVLHSGVYSRELASILASLAVAGAVCLLLFLSFGKTGVFAILFGVLFIAGFPVFRKYVFREVYMETVFGRTTGGVEIFMSGVMRRRCDAFRVSEISNILIETRKTAVENTDGMEFVEKISAQHGMVIPGFGEETVQYLLTIKLADGTARIIHAGSDRDDMIAAHEEIVKYLGIPNSD